MPNPISNDKILPPTLERTSTSGHRRPTGERNSGTVTPPTDDTVQLSNSGRLASQEANNTQGSGNIRTADQARALVARIRDQIETSGADAISSHRPEQGLLTRLLESSAA